MAKIEAMIPELDIYRSANLLVKQHGQDAPIQAAMRADAMLDKGDLGGCAVWKRILRAVEGLQGTEPNSGEAVLAPTPWPRRPGNPTPWKPDALEICVERARFFLGDGG